ncbi:MAG: TonB family protein [Deltaproteobacteria bacterium]|nr:TonB family protein [Deltaproteobacteria bacterium]
MLSPIVGTTQLVSRVDPVVPLKYRVENVSLFDLIRICVNKAGLVTSADIVKPSEHDFDQAVLLAVSKWRFKPMLKDGQVVPFCYVQRNVLKVQGPIEEKTFKAEVKNVREGSAGSKAASDCAPSVIYRQSTSNHGIFLEALKSTVTQESGACFVNLLVKHSAPSNNDARSVFMLEKKFRLSQDAEALQITAKQAGVDDKPDVVYETRWLSATELESITVGHTNLSLREGNDLSEVRVAPRSPSALAQPGVDAVADARVCVDVDGHPDSVTLTKRSDPAFDLAVIDALWKWRWRPLMREGAATPFCFPLRFRLKALPAASPPSDPAH